MLRRFRKTKAERAQQAQRRARARAYTPPHCINENNHGTHGPATHGVRCHACHLTHKASA